MKTFSLPIAKKTTAVLWSSDLLVYLADSPCVMTTGVYESESGPQFSCNQSIHSCMKTAKATAITVPPETSYPNEYMIPKKNCIAEYSMCSTFLTASPGSVLFSRSNLLKRNDLCFSCLRLGLIRHRRSLRSSHLFLKCCHDFVVSPLNPSARTWVCALWCRQSLHLHSPFLKCP
jgi:hypothetical protein